MKRYVVGFMFDDEMRNVCMIRKNRPDWQAGLLNGVGGRIELFESSIEAMKREFREETGVCTIAESWEHVCTLRFPYAEIEFFAAKSTYFFSRAETKTDEEIVKVPLIHFCSYNHVENIPHLINLSIQRLSDRIGVASVSWQQSQQKES